MSYSTFEQALPMIKALELIKGFSIPNYEIDLNNLGVVFAKELLSLSHKEKINKSILTCHNNELEPKYSIGSWAFFPDIAIQKTNEEAFGLIVGARDTEKFGFRYFLHNPFNKLIDIQNSTPYLMDLDIDIDNFYKYSDPEIIMCSDYLNRHCVYLDGDIPTLGYIVSFNSDSLSIKNDLGLVVKISFIDRLQKILFLHDDVTEIPPLKLF